MRYLLGKNAPDSWVKDFRMLDWHPIHKRRRKLKNLLAIVTSLVLLAACEKHEQDKNDVERQKKQKSVLKEQIQHARQVSEKQESKVYEQDKRTKNKFVLINGVKMGIEQLPLLKGAEVVDTGINQTARVQGSITVVLQAGRSTDFAELDLHSKKLAKDTYKLTPGSAGVDMLALYQQLASTAGIKQVELDLNYPGHNGNAEM